LKNHEVQVTAKGVPDMKMFTATLSLILLLGTSASGFCSDYDVSTSNGTSTNNSTENVQKPKADEPGTVEKIEKAVDKTLESTKNKLEKKLEQRQGSGGGAVRG
jgi:hypothetical protein